MRITSQKGFSGIDERVNLQDGIGIASKSLDFRVTDGGSICKRPEKRLIYTFSESSISGLWHGIFKGKEWVFIITYSKLYRFDPNLVELQSPEFIAEVPIGVYEIFEFHGMIYFKSDSYYGKYDGENVFPVEGYIPCVAMGCSPSGEGEPFEQINLICDKRRQLFSGDGTSVLYNLAENDIDSIVSVKVDGKDFESRYGLHQNHSVSFETPPPEGLNNVEIVYEKKNADSDRRRIFGCTKIMFFGGNSDGRAFLWGNPEFPNYRFHSELADGIPSVEYFPVNAFTVIGNSPINCIVQQYDRQLIFTKSDAFYSYCELRDDGLGNTISSFPVFSLNGSKGCVVPTYGCVIDNRPVTLCEDGLNMWEATSVENEKNAICFSGPIVGSIKDALSSDKSDIRLFDFQANRELYFIYGRNAYIFNYGNGSWYSYSNLRGDRFCPYGPKVFFSDGMRLLSLSYEENGKAEELCRFESAPIRVGQSKGHVDIIGIEADVSIKGDVELTFGIERTDGEKSVFRQFKLSEDERRYLRLSCRTAVKRVFPFKLIIEAQGTGVYAIHGVTIITREKERRKRNGLL